MKQIWKSNLWPCVNPMPVEVEVHTVSYFKAPFNGEVELWEPECDDTFTVPCSKTRHLPTLKKQVLL